MAGKGLPGPRTARAQILSPPLSQLLGSRRVARLGASRCLACKMEPVTRLAHRAAVSILEGNAGSSVPIPVLSVCRLELKGTEVELPASHSSRSPGSEVCPGCQTFGAKPGSPQGNRRDGRP